MKCKYNSSLCDALKRSVFTVSVLATVSMTAMAESIELSVKGAIIPAACTPTVIGEINYGNIAADKLSKTEYTVLAQQEVDFTISCDAPVKVAIQAINGRPGSVAGGEEKGANNLAIAPVELLGYSEVVVAGLGTHGGEKIGGYAIGLLTDTLEADGDKMVLKLRNVGEGWSDYSMGSITPLYYRYSVFDDILTYSWADSAATETPTAIKSLSAKFVVQAYVNNTTVLDTSSAIQLDGLTTIELVYL